jgi:hypothetical protein
MQNWRKRWRGTRHVHLARLKQRRHSAFRSMLTPQNPGFRVRTSCAAEGALVGDGRPDCASAKDRPRALHNFRSCAGYGRRRPPSILPTSAALIFARRASSALVHPRRSRARTRRCISMPSLTSASARRSTRALALAVLSADRRRVVVPEVVVEVNGRHAALHRVAPLRPRASSRRDSADSSRRASRIEAGRTPRSIRFSVATLIRARRARVAVEIC